jgi:formylglycine-generating enzyme required for sulfatase activity
MSDFNENITDNELRELLKRRLLVSDENDPLTQKLVDMEALYVFGTAQEVAPGSHREQEMLDKLRTSKWKLLLRWLIPGVAIVCSAILYFAWNNRNEISLPAAKEATQPLLTQGGAAEKPVEESIPVSPSHDTNDPGRSMIVFASPDTVQPRLRHEDDMPPEDPRIYTTPLKGNTKLKPQPYEDQPAAEPDIPSLSKGEIAENNKLKNKMIKQLLKKDPKHWVLIPGGKGTYKGDSISVNAFYMATMEVSNKNYRVFLNDLLAQGRTDEYLKALPDTGQWLSLGGQYFEPMAKNYFWHYAYDDYPVVCVSRTGAEMYCSWLTEAVNTKITEDHSPSKAASLLIEQIRLPYDEEWVIAARGGIPSAIYPWNLSHIQNAKGCYLANFNIKKSEGKLKPVQECYVKHSNAFTSAGTVLGAGWSTAFVYGYNPNKYGLYNICGNVAEMVRVKKTGEPGTKGGSWNSNSELLKIEAEDEFKGMTGPSPMIGFRPVYSLRK